jgi:hypothetical protein
MNLYQYGRSSPGRYGDPYGMESIVLDLTKLILKEDPSVTKMVNELKEGLKDFVLGWPTWAKVAAGAAAGYGAKRYLDSGGSIDTGYIGITCNLLGGSLTVGGSGTIREKPTGGIGGTVNAGFGLKFLF